MENLGTILVTIAMAALVIAVIFLLIEIFKVLLGDRKFKEFRWKTAGFSFMTYLILITIGIIMINL